MKALFTVVFLLLVPVGCATKTPVKKMQVLGHTCTEDAVVIGVSVQADEPQILTLSVPKGLCGGEGI